MAKIYRIKENRPYEGGEGIAPYYPRIIIPYHNLNTIDKEWDPGVIYRVDEVVKYNGTIYVCITGSGNNEPGVGNWEDFWKEAHNTRHVIVAKNWGWLNFQFYYKSDKEPQDPQYFDPFRIGDRKFKIQLSGTYDRGPRTTQTFLHLKNRKALSTNPVKFLISRNVDDYNYLIEDVQFWPEEGEEPEWTEEGVLFLPKTGSVNLTSAGISEDDDEHTEEIEYLYWGEVPIFVDMKVKINYEGGLEGIVVSTAGDLIKSGAEYPAGGKDYKFQNKNNIEMDTYGIFPFVPGGPRYAFNSWSSSVELKDEDGEDVSYENENNEHIVLQPNFTFECGNINFNITCRWMQTHDEEGEPIPNPGLPEV